jgi:hypothetical protein
MRRWRVLSIAAALLPPISAQAQTDLVDRRIAELYVTPPDLVALARTIVDE